MGAPGPIYTLLWFAVAIVVVVVLWKVLEAVI